MRLDDYLEAAGEEAVERVREIASSIHGARVLHVNSTAFGGGVAELLHTQVALLNDVGIDTTWVVIQGSDEYFTVTKFVHNALQGAETPWTETMVETYWERTKENARELAQAEDFDFIFIHDPQPVGFLPLLADQGRRMGRWLWRCHIDLSTPFTPVWSFFEPMVNLYDAAIFTMEEFAQPGVRDPVLAYVPPSIDPLSTKNVPLSKETTFEVLHRYGIDGSRPIVTQVSRFDPWKDPIGVIDAYRLARKEIPELQLVMVGSMAHDDPEGMHYLDLTESHRDGDPEIHLLTNFQEVGSLEVNAFQRASNVIVQKSLREGFGLVVAEGMWKEKPVIGGNAGGIRLQIEEGETGFLVESVGECADRIVELVRDPAMCARMGRVGHLKVKERFLTLRELEDYLRLMASLS